MEFRGVFTALLTPFDDQDRIDWSAFDQLVRDQIQNGISGVIPCGTTGESPTLTLDEKKALIDRALALCAETPTRVIAGTGSNSTQETVGLSRWASERGVAAVLVVTPYYNKPPQKGLIAHYTAIADAVECPVILYNVPGRTAVALAPQTIATLSLHPKIRAIKESSGRVAAIAEIQQALNASGKPMALLCGDDPLYLDALRAGAQGIVSVASNLIPLHLVQLQSHWDLGETRLAQELQDRCAPLFQALFLESNPIPAKAAAQLQGRMKNQLRLPLMPAEPTTTQEIKRCLKLV